MPFKQIVNQQAGSMSHKAPYVRFVKGHIVFNEVAIEAIGEDNKAAVILFDDQRWLLVFCFVKENHRKELGTYVFAGRVGGHSAYGKTKRFISAIKLLKDEHIEERVKELGEKDFPLDEFKESVEGFEGERLWVVDLGVLKR